MVLLGIFINFRTVSNCRRGQGNKGQSMKPAGALTREDEDVEMGGGDSPVIAVAATHGTGVVDECTVTPIVQVDGEPVHELVDTPKPKKKPTKHACERDEVTAKVLNILEKDADDDDEVSLALASIGKRIKKTLKEGQVDAVIDELNEVVGHHVWAARTGVPKVYQRQPVVHQKPQIQGPAQQQQQQQHQQPQQGEKYGMALPPLQRMDIAYDPMNNNTYHNL